MDDTELRRLFISGGEDGLETVIGRYGERLLRYATAVLCDYQEAEDAVQEVFITAYKNRAAFDGENLSAWLYKMTYNRSINMLKKRRILFISDVAEKAEHPVPRTEMSDETLRALRRLKPKERALLFGRIIEGQSYEEISALTGISTSALRKRYERAKKKLAGYLAAGNGKELTHENHEYI